MRIAKIYFLASFILSIFLLWGCEDFFSPDQGIVLKEENHFKVFDDYRAAEMGLYALQQKLVEQLVVLGELRGDMLDVTDNADRDLIDINEFNQISPSNKYASPTNFYKLIANCNYLLQRIAEKKPSVLFNDSIAMSIIDSYDYMYSSVLCMRAWAYFNASRIYGRVPYIPHEITNIEGIRNYINQEYTSVRRIIYRLNSDYVNDGVDVSRRYMKAYDTTIVIKFPKIYVDVESVVDTFTTELETKVKKIGSGLSLQEIVGVNYNSEGVNDRTWECTTWNRFAYHALLGQMYLTRGNMPKANEHFRVITDYQTAVTADRNRFMLSQSFVSLSFTPIRVNETTENLNVYLVSPDFKNYLSGIDIFEHVYVLPFSRASFQTNELATLFDTRYKMKPTSFAVNLFEQQTRMRDVSMFNNNTASDVSDDYYVIPEHYLEYYKLELTKPAIVRYEALAHKNNYTTAYFNNFIGYYGDWCRGYGVSYIYKRKNSDSTLKVDEVKELIFKKMFDRTDEAYRTLLNYDTVVTKFSYTSNGSPLNKDNNFSIYKAGGIHCYNAEVYCRMLASGSQGDVPSLFSAFQVIGDGVPTSQSKGVRGRVGLDILSEINVLFETNYNGKVAVRYPDVYLNKIFRLEEKIIDEKAMECSFEGERFYDLMRVAKRRNDPSFLARKVSAKFTGAKRDKIYQLLLNENNWYIPFYENLWD